MKNESPYEYHNGLLGVKINFLFKTNSRKKAHPNSLSFVSYITLYKRMTTVTCQEVQLRRGFLGHPSLIKWDSLCFEWQDALTKRFGTPPKNLRKTIFQKNFVFDQKAWQFYADYREGSDFSPLPMEKRYEYTHNASVLNTVGKIKEIRTNYRRLKRSSTAGIWDIISAEVNNFHDVEHTLPVSADGLRKKYARYKKQSYKCLIDGRRNNTNAQIKDDTTMQLLNNLFAGQEHKPTYTEVYNTYESFLNGYTQVINPETGELYNPKDHPRVARSTIMGWLSDWENKIGTWQVRGADRQKNMERFKPHHVMELPVLAGSIISIDDRQPPFQYEKSKRMWFYNGVDVASGAITVFVYGKTKEGIIMDFYRQLVRNYTAWGIKLPFELECESSLNSSFKETFLKEGTMFQKVRIEANNARGKYIERINGKLRYEYEKDQPGFLARPHAGSESNESQYAKAEIIPYEELSEARVKDIIRYNNSPHRNKELGLSKWEYFLKNQDPALPDTDWVAILPYIGYHTTTSCKAGYIRLENRKRMIGDAGAILTGQPLVEKMKRIEGKKLDVYWLDAHDGTVLKAVAFYQGEYVCEVMQIPTYNRAKNEQTEQDFINRELQSKYANTVIAFGNQQVKKIDKVMVIEKKKEFEPKMKFTVPGITHAEPLNEDKEVEVLYDYKDELEEQYETIQGAPRPHAQEWRDRYIN